MDAARTPFKALRDAENNLTPRRNIRAGMQTQLARLEHDQQKGTEKKIAELKDQIKKAELDDQPQEKEVELLKRKAIRESEQLKWEAMREVDLPFNHLSNLISIKYGEKLVLLSQAATPIIGALPSIPPSSTNPYTGAQATGAARASLQRALDNYKTGHINLPPHPSDSELHRSDTRSFGESHASELSSITSNTTSPGVPSTPPDSTKPLTQVPSISAPKPTESTVPSVEHQSLPLNPPALNQSPAQIPPTQPGDGAQHVSPQVAVVASNVMPAAPAPAAAETAVTAAAGSTGPGPASHDTSGGVLANVPATASEAAQRHESAEEEKKRLQATYSQAAPTPQPEPNSGAAAGTSTSHHESAEDEKKRLEQEERERLLRGGTDGNNHPGGKSPDEELPPYQDL